MFEQLYESAQKGELLLVDGGFTRYHITKKGQLTIYEILVLPEAQGAGIGVKMLGILKQQMAKSIFAKCPDDLPANSWYAKNGFECEETETTKSGRILNHWRLTL